MFRVVLVALLTGAIFSTTANASQITVSGSTSVSRIMDVLAEEFNASGGAAYVAVQGIGSTAGIAMVEKDVADIGMISRYMTEAEYDEKLTVIPFAFDGLAVVTHHSNPVKNITREQLFSIYKGKLTNWNKLGGEDRHIAAVTREQSSGSRGSFEALMGLLKVVNKHQVSEITPSALVVNSNSMVKMLVNHNPQAVGFISSASVDSSVNELTFEGVSATPDNIASQKYQLSRPFILLYKTHSLSEDGRKFINFIRSDRAKQLILQYGYVPAS